MNKNKLHLTLICILIMSSTVFSQFQVGPLAGANFNGLNIDPEVQGRNINTKTGYTLGAASIYNFSSMFSIQVEPAYSQKGASIYSAITDDGLILELDQSVEMNYVDIPILFKLSFGGDFIEPYLLAGTYIGVALEDTKVRIDNVIANGEDVTTMIPSEDIEQELKNKNVDYGLNLGAGISFPLDIFDIFLQAQYNFGLTDMNDETPPEGVERNVIKNRSVQLKTGIIFSF